MIVTTAIRDVVDKQVQRSHSFLHYHLHTRQNKGDIVAYRVHILCPKPPIGKTHDYH